MRSYSFLIFILSDLTVIFKNWFRKEINAVRDLKLRMKDISQDLNLRSMVKWPHSHSDDKLIPISKKSFDKKTDFFLFPFHLV